MPLSRLSRRQSTVAATFDTRQSPALDCVAGTREKTPVFEREL